MRNKGTNGHWFLEICLVAAWLAFLLLVVFPWVLRQGQ